MIVSKYHIRVFAIPGQINLHLLQALHFPFVFFLILGIEGSQTFFISSSLIPNITLADFIQQKVFYFLLLLVGSPPIFYLSISNIFFLITIIMLIQQLDDVITKLRQKRSTNLTLSQRESYFFKSLHSLTFSAEPAFGATDYVPTPEKKLIDLGAQDWEATDMLGRRVASVEDVRGRKKDRKVGIFYWTWRESHAHLRPVDVVDVLEKYPAAEYRKDHPAWGERPFQCHWHEPFYGFYRNSDPWVIRHHAALLAAAGVDMIMFDCTNGALLWRDAYEPLLRGLHEAREDGIRTPQVAFMMNFCPAHSTELMLRALYQNLYKPGLYSDLWFRLDGKPLVMAYPDALPETGVCETDTRLLNEIRDFFTFRPGQPLYAGGAKRPDQWGWLEVFPQNKYVTRPDGSCELVTVGVGQNANAERICTHFNDRDTFGRSYTGRDGFAHLSPDSYKYGYNVQEQWDRAIDLDPDIVFVTGWNEWIMGQFHEPWLSDNDSTQLAMVDQYDREHSRVFIISISY